MMNIFDIFYIKIKEKKMIVRDREDIPSEDMFRDVVRALMSSALVQHRGTYPLKRYPHDRWLLYFSLENYPQYYIVWSSNSFQKTSFLKLDTERANDWQTKKKTINRLGKVNFSFNIFCCCLNSFFFNQSTPRQLQSHLTFFVRPFNHPALI